VSRTSSSGRGDGGLAQPEDNETTATKNKALYMARSMRHGRGKRMPRQQGFEQFLTIEQAGAPHPRGVRADLELPSGLDERLLVRHYCYLQQRRRFMGGFSIWHWLIVLIIAFIFIYPICRIVGKAGYNPALGLLWLIPIVNFVLLWVFAFSDWPVSRAGASGMPPR
jgi:hypothetical protein